MDTREFNEIIKDNISKVMVGCDEAIELILTAILVSGHVLIEDVPGLGKTMLAKSLAKSIDSEFNRIQFTPDLLPSDLIGINYFNQKKNEFVFKKGPLFSQIVLADEINRATPRTQSSLLESMAEKQITVDGQTYKLNEPFLVIATQNPIESRGTFPLPEAQLDRFIIKLSLGYPKIDQEKDIIKKHGKNNPIDELKPVVNSSDVNRIRELIKKVHFSDVVIDYMLQIINETRNNENIILGVSPRGSLGLYVSCQAYAALKGRNYVLPDDVKYLSKYVLPHRIIVKGQGFTSEITPEKEIMKIIDNIKVPVENFTTQV